MRNTPQAPSRPFQPISACSTAVALGKRGGSPIPGCYSEFVGVWGASNQTARELQQALIAGQIGDNNVEQGWWNFGAAAGAAASVATGGDGVDGPSVSGLAMRPSTIMNESINIDIQRSGSIGTAGEYLARTAHSNDTYAQDREDVETIHAEQTEAALAAQYGVQSGAISVWNAQVNRAADTQARMSGRAAAESTAMLDEAAKMKLGGGRREHRAGTRRRTASRRVAPHGADYRSGLARHHPPY